MVSFADLTKQVHCIKDMILSDMVADVDTTAESSVIFSQHLLATKYWFTRISYSNKKRYLLALLQDIRSAWTLSLLLKSMWNCRPKDAVMSVSERSGWFSCYDEAPMDHNRTALPVGTLAQVMKNDRYWLLSLDPEPQALVLAELLTVAGGPAVWEVLRRAQTLYDRYQDQLMQNLNECVVLQDNSHQTDKKGGSRTPAGKASNVNAAEAAGDPQAHQASTPAEKEVEGNLVLWNATIKQMRDSFKLEEFEMTFKDGSLKKIWKVNRIKPDNLETVDFLQLLPSSVGKMILSYIPLALLADYSRVNRYWGYLIEEYRAEVAARNKINSELEKLKDIVLKHDESLEEFLAHNSQPATMGSEKITSSGVVSPMQPKPHVPSCKASEKSAGIYSLRNISDKLAKPLMTQKPFRNLAELHERLEIRGAADENIWKWCENILTHFNKRKQKVLPKSTKKLKKKPMKEEKLIKDEAEEEGVLLMGENTFFSCPLMKKSLTIPLKRPLCKDPAKIQDLKPKVRMSEATLLHYPKGDQRRYNLWTRDLSSLYPVFKIPSYHFPPLK